MPGMPVSEELHGERRSQRVMLPQSHTSSRDSMGKMYVMNVGREREDDKM